VTTHDPSNPDSAPPGRQAAPATPHLALLPGLADPELAQSLAANLALVEERLLAEATDSDALVSGITGYLLRGGGKRLRPLVVLIAAELGGGCSQAVLDAAVVVELTHVASLYHDDVIDAAPLRRGTPSAHIKYGNTVAILAGDLLFAKASAIGAALGEECVRIQAGTFARMCRGEIRESAGPAPGQDPIAHHLAVLRDKTASLIGASAHLGALLADCPAPVVEAVVAFGEKAGLAFQLADDIIDLSPDAAITGKLPGTDLREHVPTMPALLLQAEARADRDAGRSTSDTCRLADILEGDLSDDATLSDAVAHLAAHRVTREARAIARRWAAAAAAELAPLPSSPAKQALTEVADQATSRLA
jgi:heptaprenyl diphosphate synthase